jgi:hypothetical protein
MGKEVSVAWKALPLVICSLMTASPGRAAMMYYGSQPVFLAASRSMTTLTFNGIAGGSFVEYAAGPFVLSGVTFTSNNDMYVIDPGYYGFPYPAGGILNSDYSNPNIITAVFPASTAVSFRFGGLLGAPVSFTVRFSTGDSFVLSSSTSFRGSTPLTFAGFTSTAPLTGVTFTMPDAGNYNAIDDFSYGISTVPEPATLGLFGLGGIFLGFLRRNK